MLKTARVLLASVSLLILIIFMPDAKAANSPSIKDAFKPNEKILAQGGLEDETGVFVLPSSLKAIDNNAFEGTNANTIILSGSIETIGDYAFADIQTLKSVIVPDSICYISNSAFAGSDHVSIIAEPNTYTKAWASRNGIPFYSVANVSIQHDTNQFIGNSLTHQRNKREIISDRDHNEKKQKPTGRLNRNTIIRPVEEYTANSIKSRAPPKAKKSFPTC